MTLPEQSRGRGRDELREVEPPVHPNPNKPRLKKYKHADNVVLRKNVELALAAAIENMMGGKMVYRVLSSSITHTDLQPEGDQFTISFVIETHEKPGGGPPDNPGNQ